MGVAYVAGTVVPKDYAGARTWFLKAADQGEPDALQALGLIYLDGYGVPQDDVEAYRWFDLAASHYPLASFEARRRSIIFRDRVALRMTSAGIAEAQRLAREWKPHNAK